ncbi:MAG: type II toxin-antitoxin system VapC family toxin [Saprospiraceae bacterium]
MDSHTLIWFFENDARLPAAIRLLLEDGDNAIYVSIASFWEMAIKKSLQKLVLQKTLSEMFRECENQQIEILPVLQQDIEIVEAMPFHHRDPFDRIIIAVGISRNLEIVGLDVQFDAYAVQRIW